MADVILPVLILTVLIVAFANKTNCYNAFCTGAKSSFLDSLQLLPYIAAMFIAVSMLRTSGVGDFYTQICAPLLKITGIPQELAEIVLLRPFSGSGSLALLSEIYSQYGADSYVSRCASVIMGSTETVFYVSAIYLAKAKLKKLPFILPITLFCTFVGAVLSCLLCSLM